MNAKQFKTHADIATAHGVSRSQVQIVLADGDVQKGKLGWSALAVAKAFREHAANTQRGDGSLGDELIKRRITKFDIEIGQLRGELKPMDEWRHEVQELAAMVKGGLEQWVQHVAADFKDPSILTRAQECRDDVLRRIAERVEDADESDTGDMAVVTDPAA